MIRNETRSRRAGLGRGAANFIARTWLAWLLCAIATGLALVGQYWSYVAARAEGETYGDVFFVPMFAAPSLLFGALGALILTRAGSNLMGRLFVTQSLAWAIGDSFSSGYAARGLLHHPGSLPGADWGAVINNAGMVWVAGLFVLIMLFFPSGRLTSRHSSVVLGSVLAAIPIATVAALTTPDPIAVFGVISPVAVGGPIGRVLQVAGQVAIGVLMVMLVVSFVSVLVRKRRASGVERNQIKWFQFAACVFIAEAMLLLVFNVFFPAAMRLEGPPAIILATSVFVGLLALPAGTGIAILRYRLYEIDRLISRTLAYGALTALLVGGYLLAVLGLQSVLPVNDDSPVIVAASTLAAVAAFGPLRTRVQNAVDSRFNRSRYDAQHTIEDFGARLRSETNLDALSTDLVAVADQTMQPSHVSLWLRSAGDN